MNVKSVFRVTLPLLFVGLSSAALASDIWRAIGQAAAKDASNLIQPQKELQPAAANAKGVYQLSSSGKESKPLVVIGTPFEIMAFLAHNLHKKIESGMGKDTKIYMGIAPYTPGEPFKNSTSLKACADESIQTIENVLGKPRGAREHILASIDNFIAAIRDAHKQSASEPDQFHQSQREGLMMVQFSATPGNGMTEIAQHSIGFESLLEHFRQSQFRQTKRDDFQQTQRQDFQQTQRPGFQQSEPQ